MNPKKGPATCRTLAALMLAVLMIASCQSMDTGDAKKAEAVPRLPDVREFEDVLVPREMSVSRDASFIHRGTSLPTGLLRLAGSVEASSLMRYFQANMPKDGWQMVSEKTLPAGISGALTSYMTYLVSIGARSIPDVILVPVIMIRPTPLTID